MGSDNRERPKHRRRTNSSVQKLLKSRALLRDQNEKMSEEMSVMSRERRTLRAKTIQQREEIHALKKKISDLEGQVCEREDKMLSCDKCKVWVPII